MSTKPSPVSILSCRLAEPRHDSLPLSPHPHCTDRFHHLGFLPARYHLSSGCCPAGLFALAGAVLLFLRPAIAALDCLAVHSDPDGPAQFRTRMAVVAAARGKTQARAGGNRNAGGLDGQGPPRDLLQMAACQSPGK